MGGRPANEKSWRGTMRSWWARNRRSRVCACRAAYTRSRSTDRPAQWEPASVARDPEVHHEVAHGRADDDVGRAVDRDHGLELPGRRRGPASGWCAPRPRRTEVAKPYATQTGLPEPAIARAYRRLFPGQRDRRPHTRGGAGREERECVHHADHTWNDEHDGQRGNDDRSRFPSCSRPVPHTTRPTNTPRGMPTTSPITASVVTCHASTGADPTAFEPERLEQRELAAPTTRGRENPMADGHECEYRHQCSQQRREPVDRGAAGDLGRTCRTRRTLLSEERRLLRRRLNAEIASTRRKTAARSTPGRRSR